MADFQSPSALAELSTNVEAPLVSIGMPVYNGAEYIQEALDSFIPWRGTELWGDCCVSINSYNGQCNA
jgi:hypothetical protein